MGGDFLKRSLICIIVTFLVCLVISICVINSQNRLAAERLDNAKIEQYDQGYTDGYNDGHEDGYSEGSSSGYDEGYDDGKEGNLSPADKRTVYVTPSGRKYHRKSCSSIKGHDTEKLQTWEAKERGYTACARCNP